MVRVYVDMVADLFHYGHIAFLRQARALGDHLLVGIIADEPLLSYKRRPILTMEERAACVAGCRYVDEVLPNAPLVTGRAWVEEHDIHLVVHGDDYSQEQVEYYYKEPWEMGIYRTVPYTGGISTSEIIERTLSRGSSLGAGTG
jgi:cytidyltransferase-like protein